MTLPEELRQAARYTALDHHRDLLERAAAKIEANQKDVARYQWLRAWTRGMRTFGVPEFILPRIEVLEGRDIMRGSVSQHLDAAIDAALSTQGEKT
jgi:hypothetical protein